MLLPALAAAEDSLANVALALEGDFYDFWRIRTCQGRSRLTSSGSGMTKFGKMDITNFQNAAKKLNLTTVTDTHTLGE